MSLLLLSALAFATQIGTETVPCPLGGAPVTVYRELTSNRMGGYDSDTATYASGGQFRKNALATCPDSLLSLSNEDMRQTFDPAVAARLRAALDALRPSLSSADAAALKPWERYRIGAEMYRALGRPPLAVATLYLEASWTARDVAVGEYLGLNGPQGARALLDAGALELAKPLSTAQQKTLRYNLARVAWRGGYSAEARAQLAAFEALGGLDAAERAALARFREMTEEVEPAYQDWARAAFRAALDGPALSEADRAKVYYLLGDLARRRGDRDEALGALRTALAAPRLDENLRTMAEFLVSELSR